MIHRTKQEKRSPENPQSMLNEISINLIKRKNECSISKGVVKMADLQLTKNAMIAAATEAYGVLFVVKYFDSLGLPAFILMLSFNVIAISIFFNYFLIALYNKM